MAGSGNAFSGNVKQRWSEGRIAELERKIGQPALAIDFFERLLAVHRGAADAASSGKSKRKSKRSEA
jgi:hypothetical protein